MCNSPMVSRGLQFLRCVQYWELKIFLKFYEFNSFLTGWRNGEDELCWKLDKSRGFEMGGYYISLVSTTAVSFPWEIIWKSKVLPRVAF